MKSGLYDCAGDSATASAAAWAKRLLAPITNTSNVYLGLMPVAAPKRASSGGAVAGCTGSAVDLDHVGQVGLAGSGRRLRHLDAQFDHQVVLRCGRVQQAGEVTLDPALGELVGDADHQTRLVLFDRRRISEPCREGAGVQHLREAVGDGLPAGVGGGIGGHANGECNPAPRAGTTPTARAGLRIEKCRFAGISSAFPHSRPQVWKRTCERWRRQKHLRVRVFPSAVGPGVVRPLSTTEIFCDVRVSSAGAVDRHRCSILPTA